MAYITFRNTNILGGRVSSMRQNVANGKRITTTAGSNSPTWLEGPGANAPSWSGKTTYTVQRFTSPIPTVSEVNGFRGFQGFDGSSTYLPTRVTYPTVSTPLGTQSVLQITYPGQVENITANEQTTTAWPWASTEFTNVAVKITGTWSGTLQFETSADGISWSSLNMTGRNGATTGTSTTVNGLWSTSSAATIADYFRVRASSWTSGTAIVNVGMTGGQSPARFTGGRFTGNPTRIYARTGFRTSADWSNNGNTGTKLFFFTQQTTGGQSTNHYVGLSDSATGGGAVWPIVATQPTGWGTNRNINPSQGFAHGTWHDLEFIAHAGTAGGSDGIIQVWVDGIQVINQNDVALFGNAMNPWFTALFWDPTFGGGLNPPRNDTLQIAQIYIESAS
jgi:hypothetical protein